MRSNLESRLVSLEARQPLAKSDSQKFLEKCTDGELRRLLDITEDGGYDIDKLPPEDKAFVEDLEARYGHC
jgi:hypothetical protein